MAGAVLLAGTALVIAGCTGDSGKTPKPTAENPVTVSVEAVPEAAIAGQSVTLVWQFELAEDWHLYWVGRNDSGFAPMIDLNLPEGWVAGGLQWPVPERHVSPGEILDHVYFGELTLLQKVGVPADAPVGGKIDIAADVQWLACKNMCVPGRETVTVALPVLARVDTKADNPAAAAAALLPGPLPAKTLETRWDGTVFHIHAPAAKLLTFMPTEDCGQLVDLLHDGQGDRLALRFKPKGETVGPVRGLITIEDSGGTSRTYQIDYPAVALADAPSGG